VNCSQLTTPPRHGLGRAGRRLGAVRVLALALCAAVCVVALVAAQPAFSLNTHVPSTPIGSAGSGAGQVRLRAFSNESETRGVAGSGVAVNMSTHDVYVADTGNHRVDEFEADRVFVRAWGFEVDGLPGFGECTSISSCQGGVSGSEPGQFESPVFIAVDNSPSGEGDVYVGDAKDDVITKFTASGAVVSSWGTNGQLTEACQKLGEAPPCPGSRLVAFPTLMGLVVDSSGNLDVLVNYGGELGAQAILQYSRGGGLVEELEAAGEGNEPAGLAIDGFGDFFKARSSPFRKVFELNESGSMVGRVTESASTTGIAAAGSDVYVDQGTDVEHFAFSASEVVSEPGGKSCHVPEGCNNPTDSFGSEILKAGAGLAVDSSSGSPSSGDVFVADAGAGQVDVFRPASVAEVSTEGSTVESPSSATVSATVDPDSLTLSSCDLEYKTEAESSFGAHAVACTPIPGGVNEAVAVKAKLEGLAPDTNYLYRVSAGTSGASGGESHGQTQSFQTMGPAGVEFARVGENTRTGASVEAFIDTHGFPAHYRVEYGENTEYKGAPVPEGQLTGSETIKAPIGGLTLDTVYHYRIVLTSECEPEHPAHICEVDTPDATFSTLSSAPIGEEKATSVGESEAKVGAQINPTGESTSYYVQYGTSEAYGKHTPEQPLGAANAAVPVTVTLTGLAPDTTYHFRFVARNGAGASDGPDATFTTPAATSTSASTLPDNREYELVSNSGTQAEVYVPTAAYEEENRDVHTFQLFQAAAGAGAMIYMAEPPAKGGNGAIGKAEGDAWLSRRGEGTWRTEAITPVGSGDETEFQAFSSDLANGILETSVQPLLAEGAAACASAGESDLYSRTSATGAYQALLTGTARIPVGCGHPLFAGSSADGSNVIFQDEAALVAPAIEATELPADRPEHHAPGGPGRSKPCEFGCNLYESSEGHLRLINVLKGQVVPNATFGGFSRLKHGPIPERPDFSGAISSDGSRIFWTDTRAGTGMERIYVFENGTNVPVSKGAGEFLAATPDGRYALYTEEGALWRFDTQSGTRTQLEPSSAQVQGLAAINTSGEDASYVYFVADGVLTGGERNAHGETAAEGQPNLYVLHAGVSRFIATLSTVDNELSVSSAEFGGDWETGIGNRTAQMTPDGRHLLFASVRPLTGYRDIVGSGNRRAPEAEAFVYSAEDGRLLCASCNPSGAAPPATGSEIENKSPISLSVSDTYAKRAITEDGSRVFFETNLPLVSQATNGFPQKFGSTYEWEREGTGSCPVATSVFGGCVFLLSGGKGSDSSVFVDASANGSDAFFASREPLAPGTNGEVMELIDAHECSSSAPCPKASATACTGTGCQGLPPAPPSFATPPSATFNGAGNYPPALRSRPAVQTRQQKLALALRKCRAVHRRRKRTACERAAHRTFEGKTRARNAKNRRAGR
jgi:hypothetical protein